jgi:putative PIN family toxin of toxin-antitoxin system
MRVLLDANLLISFLLHPERSSPVTAVVREGILGHFSLLVPERLLEELAARVTGKPYLAQRIDHDDLEELLAILRETAEMLPEIEEPIPAVVRDPKDDYLIAHAVLSQADYLVTGDDDLLSLELLDTVRVLSPRQFWDLLKAQR